ncbi:hypothetical protein [Pedobacter gandavensis]|uniref:hypothetical protein n=1 Tax=Pedobacter gandavensis TaxID=2679963 RepID=UPI00292E98C7|nr:hypothetical protein [Pedobacter gandavensis]
MKYTLFVLFLLTVNAYGQELSFIKDKKFSGYIVAKERFVFKSVENQDARYTPSIDDVRKAERILSCNEKYLKDNQSSKLPDYPVIYKSIRRYIRQYVGFIDKSGDHIIWIILISKKKAEHDKVGRDIIQAEDGASNYWSVCINITKGYIFDMRINGIG